MVKYNPLHWSDKELKTGMNETCRLFWNGVYNDDKGPTTVNTCKVILVYVHTLNILAFEL